jgi:hypothetical protein
MRSVRIVLPKHRGDYGLDGGLTAIVGLGAMGAVGFALAAHAFVNAQSRRLLLAILELLGALALTLGGLRPLLRFFAGAAWWTLLSSALIGVFGVGRRGWSQRPSRPLLNQS